MGGQYDKTVGPNITTKKPRPTQRKEQRRGGEEDLNARKTEEEKRGLITRLLDQEGGYRKGKKRSRVTWGGNGDLMAQMSI